MVARMRTNVLKREEKGFGPISFPRVLLAGVIGAFVTLGFSRLIGFFPGCVGGGVISILVVVMTQPISGTPLAQSLAKTLQGLIITRGLKQQESETESPILNLLMTIGNVNPEDGVLQCDEVFNVPEEENEDEEVSDLIFFRDITDLNAEGLQIVTNPFGASRV